MDSLKSIFRYKNAEFEFYNYVFVANTMYFSSYTISCIFSPLTHFHNAFTNSSNNSNSFSLNKASMEVIIREIKKIKFGLFSPHFTNFPYIRPFDITLLYTCKAYLGGIKAPYNDLTIGQSFIFEYITGGLAGILHGLVQLMIINHNYFYTEDGYEIVQTEKSSSATSSSSTSSATSSSSTLSTNKINKKSKIQIALSKKKKIGNDPTLYDSKPTDEAVNKVFRGGGKYLIHFFLFRSSFFAFYDFFWKTYDLNDESIFKRLFFANLSTQIGGLTSTIFYPHELFEASQANNSNNPNKSNNSNQKIINSGFLKSQMHKFTFLTFFLTQLYIMTESFTLVLFLSIVHKYDSYISNIK